MKDKAWFAVVYMFCVTAFFSLIIIGFAQVTRDRVEANRQLAFEKAVLEAFGLAEGKSPAELHETFVKDIRGVDGDRYYALIQNGRTAGYAVPLAGKGFWAPIKGIIAIEPDRKTVKGISFHEQSETPGLGAEITQPAFRGQFEGLVLDWQDGPLGVVPFGSKLEENEVEAISGATQTCTRLEKLINDDLRIWFEQTAGGQDR